MAADRRLAEPGTPELMVVDVHFGPLPDDEGTDGSRLVGVLTAKYASHRAGLQDRHRSHSQNQRTTCRLDRTGQRVAQQMLD